MGTTISHPPLPLVEVSGPHSKIFVPAGSAFSFHPPPEHRGGGGGGRLNRPIPAYAYKTGPRHARHPAGGGRGRSPSPLFTDEYDRDRERERERGRGRRGRYPYRPASSASARSSDFDISRPGSPRGVGMRRVPGAGGRRGYFDGGRRIPRSTSAPEMGMGGVNMPMGYPGVVMPGGARAGMGPGVGMNAGVPGGMPGYGGGGAGPVGGGIGANPLQYAYPYQQPQAAVPAPIPAPAPVQPPLQPQPQVPPPLRRAPAAGLGGIPMGAYAPAAPAQPPRAHTDPPAAKMNRGKPADKRAGPQGQEWIEGDPFLDACFCTTACTCRKGHRVVYRERFGDGQTAEGEVRYLVKDQLGKDCGDHSGCNNENGEGKARSERRGRKMGPEDQCRAARMEAREGIQRLDEGLADINAKLDEMHLKQGGAMGAPGLGGLGGNPRMQYPGMASGAPNPAMMGQMGPGMPQGMPPGMGMERYGRMDPGMPAGMGGRQMGGPGPGAMPMGGMMGGGMSRFDDEMGSFDGGFPMNDEMMGPRGMMGGRRPIPPDFMDHRRRGLGGRGGPRHGPPDMDMGYGGGPPMGRGGMGGRRPRPGGRRRRPEFPDEDMDVDMDMRGGMGGRDGGGRGEFEDMGDDDEAWTDMNEGDDGPPMRQRGSPGGRPGGQRGGRPNMSRHMSGRGPPQSRGRHAQVHDEEDEDI